MSFLGDEIMKKTKYLTRAMILLGLSILSIGLIGIVSGASSGVHVIYKYHSDNQLRV